ncbi:MAG: hypothetical protein WA771_11095, partial [Chthoniobacterales bacterium]
MKKKLFRIGLALAALSVTVIVLGYAAANWWGALVWAETEARLQALGEPLTVAEIQPTPIPDELNFAAAPVFAELFTKPRADWRLDEIESFRGGFQPKYSHLVNFAREVDESFDGSESEAAQVVLDVAAREKPIWDDVRAAALRPGTVWPVDYSEGFAMGIPQVSIMITLAQGLDAQARAKLELGDSNGAARDVELTLNLADRNRDPLVLISLLVRESLVAMAIQTISAGIEMGGWSEAELSRFQRLLAEIHLTVEMQQTLRGERVSSLLEMARLDA